MGLLTRVEEIISIPMETFHNRQGFHPVDLNRLALRCMEKGSRKGIKQTYAPNRFRVLLNPSDYKDLLPFLDIIKSDIKGELRRVVEERKYLLADTLTVEVIEDKTIPEGLPQVKGHMEGGSEPESIVNMVEGSSIFEPATSVTEKTNPHEEKKTTARDSKTIILLPDSEPEKELEKGISFLREGRAQEAHTLLASHKEELKALPQFQAAVAVALEMLGRRLEAIEHYQNLLSLDGPRPEVQKKLELLDQDVIKSLPFPSQSANGFFETGFDGVNIRIESDGVYVTNRGLNPDVSVNGKVISDVILKDGDHLKIGEVKMTFRLNQGAI